MFFKESVIVAFIASQAWAAPAPAVNARAETTSAYQCNPAHSYPNGVTCDATARTLVTPAPVQTTTSAYQCNPAHSYPNGAQCDATARTLYTPASAATTTSAYQCNPAHSYPNGATCDPTGRTLVTPAPSATTTSAYKCNPAHSYPNGAKCDGTALTLYTPGPTTTATSAYQCNPAHSYPNGAQCDATARTLYTPAPSSASAAPPATATGARSGGKCPLELTAGAFEYPHLLEINGVNGYFGGVNRTANTTFTFDIPAADEGKNCNTYFSLPAKGTMEASDYTLTTVDGAKIHVDGEKGELASFIVEENQSWLVYSSKCKGGSQSKYNMYTGDSVDLSWFQDYNPCAVGMFITVS